MRRDPVTPDLRLAVLERDKGCIARRYGADSCRGRLELDHVHDGYGCMGRRAKSDSRHLVSLCTKHHQDGWATSHRPVLRQYLASVSS